MRLAEESAWGDVPAEVGGLRLAPLALDPITEVLAIGGADLTGVLKQAIGAEFPTPGGSAVAGAFRVVWSGRDVALVLGASVEVEGALCVDRSDGWAALELKGGVRDVLARLCPLDLRDGSFPAGSAARSLLNHVPLLLTRVSQEAWWLLVPRSMAGTALGDLTEAARGVAARRSKEDAA